MAKSPAHSKVSIQSWFYQKKVFLFDLDGTLYLGKARIDGAIELIQKLRALGKSIYFFTNNSSRSLSDYTEKLQGMGFGASDGEIIMSTHTLISYLKKKSWMSIYLLGTPSMEAMLIEQGVRIYGGDGADAVVVGFDKTLTYEKLLVATRLVAGGTPLVVTHPDYFCPTDEGPEPDCGAMARLLELASGKKAVMTLGKPHPAMIAEVRARTRCRLTEMVLIGDRIMTDIAMAKSAGIDALLVLSGETKARDLKNQKVKVKAVLKSVKDLV